MSKRKRAGLVKLNNLPLLQNLIRRDPPSYRDEFRQQYAHYQSQCAIFMEQPTAGGGGAQTEAFSELVGFVAQITGAGCYPEVTASFADDLARLLLRNHGALGPELREKLVQSLVLLRNKNALSSVALLQTLFPILTSTQSKALRGQIYATIVSDLRNCNAKVRNHKLNKTVQAVLFELVDAGKDDVAATAGLWAVKLTRELWKRGIWNDARTVEIMKEAALSANPKVMGGGVRFFLGVDQEREDAQAEDSDEGPDMGKVKHQIAINKKKRSHKRMEQAMAQLKKKNKNKHKPHPLNFSALHLLRDPQGLAEALFSKHLSKGNKLTMEQKLLVLQLVSRLVGLHKLTILSLYSYFLKYLNPRQRDVTQFLVCAAQATHDLVPPEDIEPIVKKIADEFVSEGVAGEVASAGLNSIREICVRQPLAMNATLLQDLTEYKGSKDKGVMMAARSLIGLYREVAPEMLKRKDRGKVASMDMKTRAELRYGQEKDVEIEGLELLEQWKEEQRRLKSEAAGDGDDAAEEEDEDEEEDEGAWDGWEVEEDDSDDETGWINVESDDEINISDSDDDDKPTPKKKRKTDAQTESEKDGQEDGEKAEEEDKSQDEEDTGGNATPASEAAAAAEERKRISTLAAKRILTPADFAKLEELKMQAGLEKLMGKKPANKHEDAVEEHDIRGAQKRGKSDKAARLAAVEEGRKDRPEYGSKRGKKLAEKAHSTTNKEKARKKNFLMTIRKAKGQLKKEKLVDTRRRLRAGAEKSRKQKRH